MHEIRDKNEAPLSYEAAVKDKVGGVRRVAPSGPAL